MAAHEDTIFALSSGGLPAGVAVIRISGGQAFAVARAMVGELPLPRFAALRSIRTRNNEILDQGLIVAFPGPHSFTGEDCVELQLHGGKAVVKAVLAAIAEFAQTRMAEAGEFSRRAFENGKIDLIEVEGLADLLVAETEMQRRLATEQSSGRLSGLYQHWSAQLTHARAMIEAELDFSDEADVPGSVSDIIWNDMQQLAGDMRSHLGRQKAGEIIRDGFKVVIAGAPNAGKSSLLNALADRDIAIVTEVAGTTRDVLQCDLDIEGYAVKFYDTAGLRETDELVEREGIRRARLQLNSADLILSLFDIHEPVLVALDANDSVPLFTVGTKLDLGASTTLKTDLQVSAETGTGIDELKSLIASVIRQQTIGLSLSIPSRERHKQCLTLSLEALDGAISHRDTGLDIAAEFLRRSSHELGRITGRVDVEDLLGRIFSEFCIGK
ncbi:MAG: tRNA uridine-5-carboxymethylaminomethyl(34) synthesis GTPase MnmE [Allorhizobium sp.]